MSRFGYFMLTYLMALASASPRFSTTRRALCGMRAPARLLASTGCTRLTNFGSATSSPTGRRQPSHGSWRSAAICRWTCRFSNMSAHCQGRRSADRD